MSIYSLLKGPTREAARVGYTHKNQVVEAIRVSHDLFAERGLEEFNKYASLASDSDYC